MDSNIWYQLKEFFIYNRGKVIGSLIGFIFGFLILIIGFWKTLLVFLCTIIGYYLGSRFDMEGDFRKILDKILPPQSK
ncbi:MAG: DUF2273 domain-containing protein [Halanaerobiaceae bacterium]